MSEFLESLNISLAAPERLRWLWLVAGCVAAVVAGELQRRRRLVRWLHSAQGSVSDRDSQAFRPFGIGLTGIALVCTVFALADPRLRGGWTAGRISNRQVVCVLDRSRSMLAEDMEGSRFEAGRTVIEGLLQRAAGDAFALVSFAGSADIQVPLTRDYRGFRSALARLEPDENQIRGSRLGSGLERAVACFAEAMPSPKLLIVLTDGETSPDDPIDEAVASVREQLGRDFNCLVIGLGNSERGARIPLQTSEASSEPDTSGQAEDAASYLMHEGKPVWTRARPTQLRELAKRVGGDYRALQSTEGVSSLLASVDLTLDEAEQMEVLNGQPARFRWFLTIAVAALLVEGCLAGMRTGGRAILRRQHFLVGIRSLLLLAAALAIPASRIAVAQSNAERVERVDRKSRRPGEHRPRLSYREIAKRFNGGVQAYQDGQFGQAARLFDKVVGADDSRLRDRAMFNEANSLYRSVEANVLPKQDAMARLREAIDLYRGCLAAGERPDDARVNIELTYRRLEQIRRTAASENDDGVDPSNESGSESASGDPTEDQDPGEGSRGDRRDSPRRPTRGEGEPAGNEPAGNEQDGNERAGNEQDGNEQDGNDVAGDDGSGTSDSSKPAEGGSDVPDRAARDETPLSDSEADDALQRIRDRAGRPPSERPPRDASPAAVVPGDSKMPW